MFQAKTFQRSAFANFFAEGPSLKTSSAVLSF